MKKKVSIVGILNLTRDSFSRQNCYLEPDVAVEKALELYENGADIIDLGAESTHPDSENVSAEIEIERLLPVIEKLKNKDITLSIDTYKPKVIESVLEAGVDMINDVTALRNPDSYSIIKKYKIPVVLMYSTAIEARAEKNIWEIEKPLDYIIEFFKIKIGLLQAQGINKDLIILDPGMGFFLGANPEPSLSVLKNLSKLSQLSCQTYISTSYKSFIGNVLNRDIHERAIGTLATEIWAYQQGVDYIRTHNVKNLKDAITMIKAIDDSI